MDFLSDKDKEWINKTKKEIKNKQYTKYENRYNTCISIFMFIYF